MINLKDLSLKGILNILFVSATMSSNDSLMELYFNDGNTIVFNDGNIIGYGV